MIAIVNNNELGYFNGKTVIITMHEFQLILLQGLALFIYYHFHYGTEFGKLQEIWWYEIINNEFTRGVYKLTWALKNGDMYIISTRMSCSFASSSTLYRIKMQHKSFLPPFISSANKILKRYKKEVNQNLIYSNSFYSITPSFTTRIYKNIKLVKKHT